MAAHDFFVMRGGQSGTLNITQGLQNIATML